MSTADNSVHLDPLIPVDSDNNPIRFDDNNATMEGTLYEIGRYYEDVGLFQSLLKYGTVVLSNGKQAVDSVQAAYFASGTIDDPRGWDDPCPPTPARIVAYNEYLESLGNDAIVVPAEAPPDFASQYVLSKPSIDQEKSKLHKSLKYVLEGSLSKEDLTSHSRGDGLTLLELMRALGETASPRDEALVSTDYDNHKTRGVEGDLDRQRELQDVHQAVQGRSAQGQA